MTSNYNAQSRPYIAPGKSKQEVFSVSIYKNNNSEFINSFSNWITGKLKLVYLF